MYAKFVTALRLMDDCIATKHMAEPAEGWPIVELNTYKDAPKQGALHPCHAAWDICFDFILANFSRPATSMVDGEWVRWKAGHPEIDATKMLLLVDAKEIQRLVRSMPPELAEQVFPVSIARFLLRENTMPLNHRLLRTFKQFHEWYGPMILAY